MSMPLLKLFMSVHDPDAEQDLIYIRTRKPMTLDSFERLLAANVGRFSIYRDFQGRLDPKYKAEMDFLASAKRNGDPTYVL